MSNDGVHIDKTGHRIFATAIADAAGIKVPSDVPGDLFQSVTQLQNVEKLHWLTVTGHKRPGVQAGLESDAFIQKSQELTSKIQDTLQKLTTPD